MTQNPLIIIKLKVIIIMTVPKAAMAAFGGDGGTRLGSGLFKAAFGLGQQQ